MRPISRGGCLHAIACSAAVLCGVLCGVLWPAAAQAQAQTHAEPAATAPASRSPAPVRVAQAKPEARPAWREMTAAQRASLEPLAGTWSQLTEAHKRKWLAVSRNYPTMPPGEQARLHTRMAEWAALSPQQRSQARLNFAETNQLPLGDRKRKWEAYQALSPEEKRKLAAGAAAGKPAAPRTAATLRPVPAQKLTRMPKPHKGEASTPRSGEPPQVDHNTLLPQPGTLPEHP